MHVPLEPPRCPRDEGPSHPQIQGTYRLSIAVAMRCESCIAFHVHDAQAGGEILEALGVAIMMGGEPAAMYACDAFEALEQFESQDGAR